MHDEQSADTHIEPQLPGASAGPLAARRFEEGPAPVGSYDIPLRPGDALAWTFKLWGESLGRLAILGFVPYALLVPFAGVAAFFVFTRDTSPEASWWSDDGMWPLLVAGGAGAAALVVVLSVASIGAVIHVVDEKTQGVLVSAPAALLASLRHVGWLVCGYLLLSVVFAAGAAAPLVPIAVGMMESDYALAALALPGLVVTAGAFVVAVRLLPLLPVIVVEDADVFTALARSWSLTRGRAAPIALAVLLFMGAWVGISIATSMLGIVPILGAFIQIGVNTVLMPLAYVFPLVIYAACVRESARQAR